MLSSARDFWGPRCLESGSEVAYIGHIGGKCLPLGGGYACAKDGEGLRTRRKRPSAERQDVLEACFGLELVEHILNAADIHMVVRGDVGKGKILASRFVSVSDQASRTTCWVYHTTCV